MVLSNLLSFVPNIISAGAGILSSIQSNNIANQNLQYQKEYNQQVFERSDNAVQRAALDMERAGLSKTLAAGSPAAVGGNSAAPQKVDTSQIALQNALNISNTMADINMKKAQIKQVNAQTDYQNTVTQNYEKQLETDLALKESETILNRTQNKIREIEAKYADKINFNQVQKLGYEVLNLYSNKNLTDKEIELKAEQIANTIQERQNLSQSEKNAVLEYARSLLEYYARARDLNINQRFGFTSNGPSSIVGKIGSDFVFPFWSQFDPVFDWSTYDPSTPNFNISFGGGGARAW